MEARMFESSFSTLTHATKITINSKAAFVDRSDLLEYENPASFSALCKEGCPNYGEKWSCPPHSPAFSDYSRDYSRVLLVVFYCSLDQFAYATTASQRVRAANSVLKSRMDSFLRSLEKQAGGRMLSSGSCLLCKTCSLKGSESSPCKKPEQMRYGIGALGLDAGGIAKNHLKHDLVWYKDGDAPAYTSVVSALLTNNEADDITDLLSFPAGFEMG